MTSSFSINSTKYISFESASAILYIKNETNVTTHSLSYRGWDNQLYTYQNLNIPPNGEHEFNWGNFTGNTTITVNLSQPIFDPTIYDYDLNGSNTNPLLCKCYPNINTAQLSLSFYFYSVNTLVVKGPYCFCI